VSPVAGLKSRPPPTTSANPQVEGVDFSPAGEGHEGDEGTYGCVSVIENDADPSTCPMSKIFTQ
jgi:hypothetical protein